MTEGLMERLEILIARSMSNLTESLKAEESSTDCKKSKLKDRKPAPQPTGSVSDPPARDLQKELDCSRITGHAKKNRKKKSQPSPRVLGASAGLNVSRASAHPSSDESSISNRRLESVKAEKNSTDCKNSNVESRKAVLQPTGFVSDLQKELNCSRNTGHAKKNRKKKSQPSPKVVGASAGLILSRASAHPSSDESSISDCRLESVKAKKNSTDCKNSNVEDRKALSDLQKELNCSRNTGHAKKNRKKKSQPSPKVVGASAGLNVTCASAHPSNDASSISDRRKLILWQTRELWFRTYAHDTALDNWFKPRSHLSQYAAYFNESETISLDCDLRKRIDELKDLLRSECKKFKSFDRKRVL